MADFEVRLIYIVYIRFSFLEKPELKGKVTTQTSLFVQDCQRVAVAQVAGSVLVSVLVEVVLLLRRLPPEAPPPPPHYIP